MLRFCNRRNPPARRALVDRLESRTLLSAGDLDPTFGSGDGVVLLPAGQFRDTVVLPGGKILAAGLAPQAGRGDDAYLARFNPDGSLDTTFGGGDGQVFADFGQGDYVNRVALQSDGRIVTFGNVLARFNPDGTLDTSVGGGDGFVEVTSPTGRRGHPGKGLAVQADDKILAADNAGVTRYTRDGQVDTSFGTGGQFGAFTNGTGLETFTVRDIALQPGGQVIVAGDGYTADPNDGHGDNILVMRLTPDGRLDRTFAGGAVYAWADADFDDFATRVAVGPDGRIAVVGSEADEYPHTLFLEPDGTGKVFIFQNLNWGYGAASDVAFAPDGKVVVAGFQRALQGVDLKRVRAARFNAPGSVDTTFGEQDGVLTNLAPNEDNEALGVAVEPDGDVVAVGYAGSRPFVLRYEGVSEVTVQAEQARLSGASVARSNAGYTGTGYADFVHARGDSVEFPVTVDVPGRYALSVRYANGSSMPRILRLDVNGQTVSPRLTFARTGSWSSWRNRVIDVDLAAGNNTVRLTSVGVNGPNLDAFTVTPAPPRLLEAEAAKMSGARPDSSNAGFSGAGYADFANLSGDSVEWSVTTVAPARKTLTFRYANGAASDRPLELRVNGRVAHPRLSFSPTGSWSTWREVSVVVELAQGENAVRLTSTGNNGPNLDWLRVG